MKIKIIIGFVIFLLFLIIPSLNSINQWCKKKNVSDSTAVLDIKKLNQSKKFLISPQEQKKIVLEHLKNWNLNQLNVVLSNKNDRLQARNFYSIILIGLLSLFFVNRKKYNNKSSLIWLLLFFIAIMYYIDVHLEDLTQRSEYKRRCINSTIVYLINNNNFDTTTFYILYDSSKTKTKDFDSTAFCRKIENSLVPNLVQIAYYLFPGTIIFAFFCNMLYENHRRKKRKEIIYYIKLKKLKSNKNNHNY